MATSAAQDKQFIAELINPLLLETAIEFIAKNLNPEDVFSEKDLADWAERSGYREETQ